MTTQNGLPTNSLPPDDALNIDTLRSEELQDAVGQWTDQLSDVSDDGEARQQMRSSSKNPVSTMIRRVQPLAKSKRVQGFTILNCLLTCVNVLVFVAAIAFWTLFTIAYVSVNSREAQDRPCYYEWSEWSPCSATCRMEETSPLPTRTRTIDNSSIVQARGRFRSTVPCPEELEGVVDRAPCNTGLCPLPLSSFDFVGPFVKNSNNATACYRIRDVPQTNQLLHIDTHELTQDVACP